MQLDLRIGNDCLRSSQKRCDLNGHGQLGDPNAEIGQMNQEDRDAKPARPDLGVLQWEAGFRPSQAPDNSSAETNNGPDDQNADGFVVQGTGCRTSRSVEPSEGAIGTISRMKQCSSSYGGRGQNEGFGATADGAQGSGAQHEPTPVGTPSVLRDEFGGGGECGGAREQHQCVMASEDKENGRLQNGSNCSQLDGMRSSSQGALPSGPETGMRSVCGIAQPPGECLTGKGSNGGGPTQPERRTESPRGLGERGLHGQESYDADQEGSTTSQTGLSGGQCKQKRKLESVSDEECSPSQRLKAEEPSDVRPMSLRRSRKPSLLSREAQENKEQVEAFFNPAPARKAKAVKADPSGSQRSRSKPAVDDEIDVKEGDKGDNVDLDELVCEQSSAQNG